MLILPIKKQWFYMILSGEKKEEYREIKPYYDKRIKKYMVFNRFPVVFRNGYKKDSPTIKCECCIRKGEGKQEWGAEQGKEYYILEILEILEAQNVNKLYENKIYRRRA